MRPVDPRPDWVQADPGAIDRALARALALPSGGWYVLDASRALRGASPRPRRYEVAGHELVAWPAGGHDAPATVAPAACPHLGADLACGRVDGRGRLVCPWHGLALGPHAHGCWLPLPVHDDGVLTWVQPDPSADGVTATPVLPLRPDPARAVDAVLRREGACEPADLLANRLDPWHGVHLHPYAFARLAVVRADDEAIDLEVAYRVTGRFTIEVGARFHCPDPRTVVMTITSGEGAGSVVETHATPLVPAGPGRPPRTAVVEATIATSDREGFTQARRAAVVLRPVLRTLAGRLWRDDLAYAERRYRLRSVGWTPGSAAPAR